jgi:transposase-like protein
LDNEKYEFYDQVTMPGISATQIARRYTVNANFIHKWFKNARFFRAAAAVEAILGRGKNKEAGAPKTLLATSKSSWMINHTNEPEVLMVKPL